MNFIYYSKECNQISTNWWDKMHACDQKFYSKIEILQNFSKNTSKLISSNFHGEKIFHESIELIIA